MKDRLYQMCIRRANLDRDVNEGLWRTAPALITALQDVDGFGHYSLRHVARMAGYSVVTLSRINNGHIRMSPNMYCKLARLLARLRKHQIVEDKP